MNDSDLPGMGDYSPPEEPDHEKASENALIAITGTDVKVCIDWLKELAEEEHTAYYRDIGQDPDARPLGDYDEGLCYDIYLSAQEALAEAERLQRVNKQGEPQDG